MPNATVFPWRNEMIPEALDALVAPGGLIVCPTKVGYILMATDGAGLERKFAAKRRKRNKPGVVLCGSIEQLEHLARLNDEILTFYEDHFRHDILLGCILPWRPEALDKFPDKTSAELARDERGTSCFVVRFGQPAEQIAAELWKRDHTVTFASSANPSGIGNRGRVDNIGVRIKSESDAIIAADDYVAAMQPGKDEQTRHEQGVMVSMVDGVGNLIPEQHGNRAISPAPAMIRCGLDYNRIMQKLSTHFNSWDYRNGQYY